MQIILPSSPISEIPIITRPWRKRASCNFISKRGSLFWPNLCSRALSHQINVCSFVVLPRWWRFRSIKKNVRLLSSNLLDLLVIEFPKVTHLNFEEVFLAKILEMLFLWLPGPVTPTLYLFTIMSNLFKLLQFPLFAVFSLIVSLCEVLPVNVFF